VTLKFYRYHNSWAVSALKTITSNHRDFRRISIYFPFSAKDMFDQDTYNQWRYLDRILVQLWESHAIRVNPIFSAVEEKRKGVSEWVGTLLPEAKKRGMIGVLHSAGV
jgi:glutamate mutase epsilon subunit